MIDSENQHGEKYVQRPTRPITAGKGGPEKREAGHKPKRPAIPKTSSTWVKIRTLGGQGKTLGDVTGQGGRGGIVSPSGGRACTAWRARPRRRCYSGSRCESSIHRRLSCAAERLFGDRLMSAWLVSGTNDARIKVADRRATPGDAALDATRLALAFTSRGGTGTPG